MQIRDCIYILDVPIQTFGRARTNLGRAAGRDLVPAGADAVLSHRMYLLISFRKSTPPQIVNPIS